MQLQEGSHLSFPYHLTTVYVSAFSAESYIVNIDRFTS